MHHHPLIELIRSALEVVEGNWRYDAIFRVLKTGFIPPTDSAYPLTDDAIDELENYVLEYGIRSRNRWLGDEEWVSSVFAGLLIRLKAIQKNRYNNESMLIDDK